MVSAPRELTKLAHFLRNEYGEGGSCEYEIDDWDSTDDKPHKVPCGDEPKFHCWGCDIWICEEHTNHVGFDSPVAHFCNDCMVEWGDEFIPRERRLAVA